MENLNARVEMLLAAMDRREQMTQAEYIRRFTELVMLNPEVPIKALFWPDGMTRN